MTRCLDVGPVAFNVPGAILLLGLEIPITSGLVAAHLLGHGADTATLNFAPGGAAAKLVGEPVFGDGYAELSSSGFLQTDVSETAAMTLIAFGRRKVTATAVRFISNFASSSAGGVGIGTLSSGASVTAVVARSGVGFNTGATSNADQWLSGSASITASAGTTTRKNYPTPVAANSSSSGERVVNGGGKLRIGNGYAATAVSQMSSALIYNRALSTEEITTMAAWQVAYAMTCGIV